jgi:hypothetical protein
VSDCFCGGGHATPPPPRHVCRQQYTERDSIEDASPVGVLVHHISAVLIGVIDDEATRSNVDEREPDTAEHDRCHHSRAEQHHEFAHRDRIVEQFTRINCIVKQCRRERQQLPVAQQHRLDDVLGRRNLRPECRRRQPGALDV